MQCLIQRTFETYTSVSYTFTKLCKQKKYAHFLLDTPAHVCLSNGLDSSCDNAYIILSNIRPFKMNDSLNYSK